MKFRAYRQTIVFALFIALFAGFALMLPGFASVDNLLTLLQNVAILGILGLGTRGSDAKLANLKRRYAGSEGDAAALRQYEDPIERRKSIRCTTREP